MNFLNISSPSVWQLGMRYIVKTVESFQNREEVIVQETVKKASCLPRELRHLIWSYVTSFEEMARSYLYTPWDSTECRAGKFFFNFIENHVSAISNHTMLRLDQIERMGFAYEGIFHCHNKEIPLNRISPLSSANPFNRSRVFSILHGFTRPIEIVKTYHCLQVPAYPADRFVAKIRAIFGGVFFLTLGGAAFWTLITPRVGPRIVWDNCSNLEKLIDTIFCLFAILGPIGVPAIALSRLFELSRSELACAKAPCTREDLHFERYFEAVRSDDDFDSCCSRLKFVPFNGLRQGVVDFDKRPLRALNLSLKPNQKLLPGIAFFGSEYLSKLRRIFNMTPLLHTLNISYCCINDIRIATIVIQLPCLTSLDISGNSVMTAFGMKDSLQFLTDFTKLSLCDMFSPEERRLSGYLNALKVCSKLKYLDVSNNAFGNDEDAYQALESLTASLEKLVIHKGTTVHPITVEQVGGLRKKMNGRVVEIESDVG